MTEHPLLKFLDGGDRRSAGQAHKAAAWALATPSRFGELFHFLSHESPLVRMRAADAIEKVSVTRPQLLAPYRAKLLKIGATVAQQEVRWHIAQILPRLPHNVAQRRAAIDVLKLFLDDKSKIVKTFAMQAMVDIAGDDADLRAEVSPIVRRLTKEGSPAMQSRGRKLLAKLGAK